MVDGGFITRQLVYTLLTTKQPTGKEKTDLDKLSKMLLSSLNKGFIEEQWIELFEKIKSLPENTFTFQVIGSKGTDNTHYYHIFKYEYQNGWKRFKNGVTRFFSAPKKRKRLSELEFIYEETKDLIIDDITLGISTGLKKKEVAIFSELSHLLEYVVFEIQINKDAKGNPILNIYYS